jgi:hypothetical protein
LLEQLQVSLGGFQFREEALLGLELTAVDAAASRLDADRVLEMQHLVIQEILDGTSRRVWAVEDAADDDGVVGGVVMAEHAAGRMGAPGERGATEEAMEEA